MSYRGQYPHLIKSVSGKGPTLILVANNGERLEYTAGAAGFAGRHDMPMQCDDIRPLIAEQAAWDAHNAPVQPEVIDMTPTWAEVMPALFAVLESPRATEEGKRAARAELMRLAKRVDALNAERKGA